MQHNVWYITERRRWFICFGNRLPLRVRMRYRMAGGSGREGNIWINTVGINVMKWQINGVLTVRDVRR